MLLSNRKFYFAPVLLGFMFVIALQTSLSLFSGDYLVRHTSDLNISWVSSAARAAVFAIIALASQRIASLYRHRLLPWIASLASIVGLVLVDVVVFLASGVQTSQLIGFVYLTGVILNAAGYAVLYMYWIELYAKMDLPHVVTYFSAVHLGSAALSYVVANIALVGLRAGCILAMPLIGAVLYKMSLKTVDEAPFMRGEESVSGWTFPTRPIVLLAIFTFANTFIRHFLTTDLKGLVLLGVVAAAIFALVIEWVLDGPDVRIFFSTCQPLMIAAALCVLVALPGFGVAGAMLSNAAYTLFSIFTTAVLCGICFQFGVDALWLFGFANASICLGSLSSALITRAVDFSSVEPAILTLVIAAVVLVIVCLYTVTASSKSLADTWGIKQVGSDFAGDSDLPTLDQRCAKLARQYGLTRREEEVLELLAQDAPYSKIEERLVISNSTLKTHTRHIYAKLGVANKKDLIDLVLP